jgi:hypothetical protein
MDMAKPRLLILIVAYNAEKNIEDVLVRVPRRSTSGRAIGF